MLSSSTQTSLEPSGIRFVTQTAQGVQLIRVTMLLREPTLVASTVSLIDGKLVFSPMALTFDEIKRFFAEAEEKWKGKLTC